MAEAIVNEVYGDDWHARSAGLYTGKSRPMSYDARASLVRAGYDEKKLLEKCSVPLTEELMRSSDIVVGVTAEHADALTFPVDIHAPSAGDAEGYDACFFLLCEGIEKLLYPDGTRWKSK